MMGFSKKRSLTGGGGDDDRTEDVIGTVKKIDKSPNGMENRVKVRLEDETNSSIYVPIKYARDLKPEHKYEFHLEESVFRGGETKGRFRGVEMIRHTRLEPSEVNNSSFSSGGSSSSLGRRF